MSDNWLNDLKAGDLVIVSSGRKNNERLSYVEKITPSGLVKVDGNLYQNGVLRGEQYCSTRLVQATDEAMEALVQKKTISQALNMMHDASGISYEQAVAIMAILNNK